MADVQSTLNERAARYGDFDIQAIITQSIKNTMRNSRNWPELRSDQQEALEMIASKIARILNGDPDYADTWHDIAGYAQLVEATLPSE
jgi:hypothetical protein